MSNRKNYLLVAVAVLALASCEKDITVKLPAYTSKLVINSKTEEGGIIKAQVGVSVSADNKQYDDPGTLQVQLFVDNVFAQNMVQDSTGYTYVSTITAQEGKQYKIQVNSTIASFGTADATMSVPAKVTINSVTRMQNARVDADGNQQDELIVSFDDPATAGDHYILEIVPPVDSVVQAGGYQYYSSSFCVNSTDQSIESSTSDFVDATTCLSSNNIFLRDPLFNGTRKELKLYVQSQNIQWYYGAKDTIYSYVVLHHVPEAGYKYQQSNQVANDTNGDPFSEPVNVYTNVVNGYGIFTMQSTDKAKIR